MKKKRYRESGRSARINPIMAALLLCALLGSYVYRHHWSKRDLSLPETDARAPVSVIEVAGDVSNPGVLFFDHAPTAAEVLAAHGEGIVGIEADSYKAADRALTTGTSLRVHRVPGGVAIDLSLMDAEKRILLEIPLDLNAVSEEDLVSIPGIGLKTAQEIVAYRNKFGLFPEVAALKNVKGIGNHRFRKVEKYFFTKTDSNQP